MSGNKRHAENKVETKSMNHGIHKDILNSFREFCSRNHYSMNIVLETFMRQYTSGRLRIAQADIVKWKLIDGETEQLNTPINKEVYEKFKNYCKNNSRGDRFFLKYVVTAFMERFTKGDLVFGYVDADVSLKSEDDVKSSEDNDEVSTIEFPKGYMRCPFCGKFLEALSENWCLVQPLGDEKRYLACKRCEGANGEYK